MGDHPLLKTSLSLKIKEEEEFEFVGMGMGMANVNVEERMKKIQSLNISELLEEDDGGDTFAERAESYYRKRPQLLALVHDLYNAYLSLAHRYSCQQQHHSRTKPQISAVERCSNINVDDEEEEDDAESSLSYQFTTEPNRIGTDVTAIVSEIVMKNVEYDILMDEVSVMGISSSSSSSEESSTRKIELQKSLLEVLESERLILLNENARLSYRVGALFEENKGVMAESIFIKRKAGELANYCMLKMREDHRVCLLTRKIDQLRGHICLLEKRNKEYYQQLLLNAKKNENCNKKNQQEEEEEADAALHVKNKGGGGGWRVSRWWDRFKNFDVFVCGPNTTST